MYRAGLITANRPNDVCYLDEFLSSFGDFSIEFFAGDLSCNNLYLDKYRDNKLITINEQDYIYLHPTVNINFNYFRLFLYFKEEKEFLSFEDDTTLTKDWFNKLQHCREIAETISSSYILSLYRPGNIYSNDEVVIVPPEDFSCTQGLFYKNLPLYEFVSYLFKRGIEHFTCPIDLILAQFCSENNIPILATNPSLIQHIGVINNGLSQLFHKSLTFEEL